MKKRNTKRSLFLSIMALILCCAMLAGTTLAWFTDTASTAVNKIQAGNLDIALEMKTTDESGNEVWKNAEGKTLQFKVNGQIPAEGTQILWEPGCTYELPELKIINKGNLKLKYKISITGIVGNADLLNAIDFTVNGVAGVTTAVGLNDFEGSLEPDAETDPITISGHMKEDAGNRYQGQSIDGIGITVRATQLGGEFAGVTGEYDSTGNEYDKNAVYPPLATYLNETTTAAKPDTGDIMTIQTSVATSTIPTAAQIKSAAKTDAPATTLENHPMADGSSLNRVLKTTKSTADSVTYDISYIYTETSGGTSTSYNVSEFSEIVANVIELSTGLKNVQVTHSHNGVETQMQEATDENASQNGYFFYNPVTGKLTIWSSKYSSFAITFQSDFVAAVNGQGYATLGEAVSAATSGSTVEVLKDAALGETIEISKNLTLKLNGNTLTNNVTGDRVFRVTKAVTFEIDGTTAGSAMVIPSENAEALGFVQILDAATVTLNGGNYSGNTNNGAFVRVSNPTPNDDDSTAPDAIVTLKDLTATTNKRVFYMDTGNELVLNVIGGTYTATAGVVDNKSMYNVFGVDCNDLDTPLTFTDVTVKTAGGACVESSGCTATYSNCNFTVSNTSNPSFVATAVAVSWDGTANINSGNYTSAGYGVYVYSSGGTINVLDGTISGGTAAACANVASNYETDATVNISGGIINGALQTAGTGATATISVTGGKFKADPTAYLASGYKATQKSDGYYHVAESTEWKDHAAALYATPVDVTNKVVTIASAEELALFGNQVSGTTNYSGYTVNITENIDLGRYTWQPINGWGRMSGITFNGNNHTIRNMVIKSNYKGETGGFGVGFVGNTNGAITWNDLTFDKADVSFYSYHAYSGNVGGVVMGYTYGTTVFNNVSVTNSTIYGYGKIGALLGMGADPGVEVTFTNCTSEDNTIAAVYDMGGLAGLIQRKNGEDHTTIEECTVENINLETSQGETYVDLNNVQATFKSNDKNAGEDTSKSITGKYWVSSGYYWGGYADYYVSYGNSEYDAPITTEGHTGKRIANSEICINK